MNQNYQEKFAEKFKGAVIDFKSPRPGRIYMKVTPAAGKEIVAYAWKELGFAHFSCITATDDLKEFEVRYNIFGNNIGLTIGFKVDREKPEIRTITDVIPGAICYERELQESFGIKVRDIPDGRRLIIPDKWPEGQYPMRKDWNKDMLPASFNDGLRRDWRK